MSAIQRDGCSFVLCNWITALSASEPGEQQKIILTPRVPGSVITGSKHILLCTDSCLRRGDSDAYEFRFLHVVVSNVYHAEMVCDELKGMWQAFFFNHIGVSLRVALAFARMLC